MYVYPTELGMYYNIGLKFEYIWDTYVYLMHTGEHVIK